MRRQVAGFDERHRAQNRRGPRGRASGAGSGAGAVALRGPPPTMIAGALLEIAGENLGVAAVGDAERARATGLGAAVLVEHVDAAGRAGIGACARRPRASPRERLELGAALRIERRRDLLLHVAAGLRASPRGAPRRRGRRSRPGSRTAPRRGPRRSPPPAPASAAPRRSMRSRRLLQRPPAARPAGRGASAGAGAGASAPLRRRSAGGSAGRRSARASTSRRSSVTICRFAVMPGRSAMSRVVDADDRRVGDDVLDRLRAEAHHAHGAVEGAVRIGVDREAHRLAGLEPARHRPRRYWRRCRSRAGPGRW